MCIQRENYPHHFKSLLKHICFSVDKLMFSLWGDSNPFGVVVLD